MPEQTVGDCSIYYEDIGVGESILFLHSAYSRGILAFGGQIQPFSQTYRCLLPDLRGHGRTRSEAKDWSTPLLADDMAGFLRALGIGRAHVIGYSLGGGVALHLAAAHPQLVRSLTVIGCGGWADPAGADEFEPEVLLHSGQTAFIERTKALHAEAHGGDWQHHLRQSARDWRAYPSLAESDWARLTMPMLLIGGEHDAYAPPHKLFAMQAKCPQAEVWTVPGCGHRPHMPTEKAKETNGRMLAFLSALG